VPRRGRRVRISTGRALDGSWPRTAGRRDCRRGSGAVSGMSSPSWLRPAAHPAATGSLGTPLVTDHSSSLSHACGEKRDRVARSGIPPSESVTLRPRALSHSLSTSQRRWTCDVRHSGRRGSGGYPRAPPNPLGLAADSVAVAVQAVRIASLHAHRAVDIARAVAGAAPAIHIRSRWDTWAVAGLAASTAPIPSAPTPAATARRGTLGRGKPRTTAGGLAHTDAGCHPRIPSRSEDPPAPEGLADHPLVASVSDAGEKPDAYHRPSAGQASSCRSHRRA
jgi:hypothetical protein